MKETRAPNNLAGAYVDKDIGLGIPGTKLIAEDRNGIQSELLNIIDEMGIVQSYTDLTQVRQALITSQTTSLYYVDSGAADVYVLSKPANSISPGVLREGLIIIFKADFACTGGAVTVNVSTLGAVSIKQYDGVTDPAAGDINTTNYTVAIYDGSLFRQLNIQFERLNVTNGITIGDGTVSLPSLSFNSDVDTGIYSSGVGVLNVAAGGVNALQVEGDTSLFRDGVVGAPGISFISDTDTGIWRVGANSMGFAVNGINFMLIDTAVGVEIQNADLLPATAGTLNLGNASQYWGDISYKTLTDRGCLGWFDEGVELQDGTIVSDTEALLAIKKHPTKKTVYGVDMLDYKTFPKVSYHRATVKGKLLKRDKNDEPISGQDGIEMTSIFSIMIGAIKELTVRIKKLENK